MDNYYDFYCYASKAFYIENYNGCAFDAFGSFWDKFDSEFAFKEFENIASRDINNLTSWQIKDIDSLPENIAYLVKMAVCAQIDYLYENGINQSNVSSVSLGKFNYSKSNDNKSKLYSDRALAFLEQTGLMYRGVSC